MAIYFSNPEMFSVQEEVKLLTKEVIAKLFT